LFQTNGKKEKCPMLPAKYSRICFFLMTLFLLLAACTPAGSTLTPIGTALPANTPQPGPTELPTPSPEITQPPQQTPTSSSLILEDDRGQTITLAGPAQRIITLGPSIVESLFALGAGSQIVGREEFSLYPPEAQEIESIGSLFGSLPAETILALEPDLVIAPEIISPEQITALEDLNLTVYYQANPLTFDDLYDNLRDLAQLSGHSREAELLVASLQERVAAVSTALEGAAERPLVFYELDATDPENPYTAGAGTFIDTLITLAGGENIGAALEGAYAQISSEQVILADPQVILLADAVFGMTPEVVASRPGWGGIQAVQDGRLFAFDPNLGSVPGPRLVDGLEEMARLIHPELFQP
jgi:iron complex transport system substrate-binding protein